MSIIFIKKLTNKLLLLRRIKPYITLEMRKLYYNSFILPIIDYGIILWQYAPKRKLIKIANLCCFVYMYEQVLYCSHVQMAPGKISCKLTGSPSLNKVFELN